MPDTRNVEDFQSHNEWTEYRHVRAAESCCAACRHFEPGYDGEGECLFAVVDGDTPSISESWVCDAYEADDA